MGSIGGVYTLQFPFFLEDVQCIHIFWVLDKMASRDAKPLSEGQGLQSLIGIAKRISTLPESNTAPENRPSQKEISSSNHPFSGAMLVAGRVRGGNP